MALSDLEGMDTPDNTGGRPEKEEQEDETLRDVAGQPLVKGNDTEDWWQEQLDQIMMNKDSVEDAIPALAGRAFVHPIVARKKLEMHGIHETDWKVYVEEYPMYEDDERIASRLRAVGVKSDTASSAGSSSGDGVKLFDSSDDSDDDSSDDSPSSGLSSLIDG